MKFTIRIIPYLMLQLMILTLIGVNDLYRADWDPRRLTELGFWLDYLTITLATIISFFSWANIKIDMYLSVKYDKSSTLDYTSDLGTTVAYKRATLSAIIEKEKTPSIEYCIDELNMKEKEKKFKYKFTNKLNKAKYSRFRNIFKKHYNNKIKQYEEFLSPKWINDNLENYKVRYVAITESYIVNGVNIKSNGNFRHKVDSRNGRIMKDNYHKWLLSLTYLMFFTSMGFKLMEGISIVVLFTIGIRVMNCIMQSIMGVRYAATYIQTKVIPELDDRQSIMEFYIKGKTVYDLLYKQEQDRKLEKLKEVEEICQNPQECQNTYGI